MVVRDIVAIKSVGTYYKKESEELQEVKTNLINVLKEIEDDFKGRDAKNVVKKIESIINDLNLYVENINYYGDFMISLANHDTDLVSKTRKDLLNTGVLR